MFRGKDWLPGRRTAEDERRTEERLAEVERRQGAVEADLGRVKTDLDRVKRAMAAQVDRLRRGNGAPG